MRGKEALKYGLGLTALGLLSTAAFSPRSRKEIGRRDKWTCQSDGDCEDCANGNPRQFREGWMVQAAHYPDKHSRSDPEYDNPSSGRILCIEGHIADHERGTSLGRRGDDAALRLLDQVDDRTYEYREKERQQVVVYQAAK